MRWRVAVFLMACVASAGSALADAAWQTVMRDREGAREVQIDRASIIRSDAGTRVAWARLMLGQAEAAAAGYASVRTLNRYDCPNRSFVTVRRIYLDADHRVVREDRVTAPEPVAVARNTVDERLWREVCRQSSVAGLQRFAERAGTAIEALGAPTSGAGAAAGGSVLSCPGAACASR